MDRQLTDIAFTASELAHVCLCTCSNAARFVKHFNHAMKYYDINTPARIAMFLSQISFDSFRFANVEDNMGLSTKQLMMLFPGRFPTVASTEGYSLNPKALAGTLFGKKYGNKTLEDTWVYRPRGFRRLIGKDSYQAAQDALGMSLTGMDAERVAEPDGACWTSAWYWCAAKLNNYADNQDLKGLVIAMAEGPTTGMRLPDLALDDRNEMWEYAQANILEVLEND